MAVKKCAICYKPIVEGQECVPYKTRYAHALCMQELTKQISSNTKKPKAKREPKVKTVLVEKQIAPSVSEEEFQKQKKLIDYLEKISGEPVTVKAKKLIKDYIEKYKLTYEGILNALVYFYEMQGNPVKNDCVGIVPYVYEEAQAFMKDIKEADEYNSKIEESVIHEEYRKKCEREQAFFTAWRYIPKPEFPEPEEIDISKIGV